MTKVHAIPLCAVLFLFGCGGVRAGNSETPTGKAVNPQVTGILVQGESGDTPVTHTLVKLDGSTTHSTTTNANGEFTFVDVPEGDYVVKSHVVEVEVNKQYPSEVTRISVKVSNIHLGKVQLPGVMVGNVSLSEGESFLGIDVFVPGTSYTAKTDEYGDFTLLNLAPGTYRLHATKLSFTGGEVPNVPVVAGKVTIVPPLVLQKGALEELAPILVSAIPAIAFAGDTVTLSGSNFGPQQGSSKLFVGAVEVPVTSWSDSQVSFAVTGNLQPGNQALVLLRSGSPSNGIEFGVRPKILSMTESATGYESVTIHGVNLGNSPGSIALSGPYNLAPTPISWSASAVTFEVSAAIPAGLYGIGLTNGLAANSGITLQVVPSISSVWPAMATAGTLVSIAGTNLGDIPETDAVLIGGLGTNIMNWTPTGATFRIDDWTAPGLQAVAITAGGAYDSTHTLTVIPDIVSITGDNPSNQAQFHLTGTNLGAEGAVFAGSLAATIDAWSPIGIALTIPPDLEPGYQAFSIQAAEINSAPMQAIVRPMITQVAAREAAAGFTIAVVGTNFGSVPGTVSFANIPTLPISWEAKRIVARVPDGFDGGHQSVQVSANDVYSLPFTTEVLWKLESAVPVTSASTGEVVLTTPHRFTLVTAAFAGPRQTCAITHTGKVECWGLSNDGQLKAGVSNPITITQPESPGVWESDTRGLAIGERHSCAVNSDGSVQCMGDGAYGQIGDGTTTDRLAPTSVSGLSSGIAALAAGKNHSCALSDSGTLACWGRNQSGQLGAGYSGGDYSVISSPVPVTGLTTAVVAVAAGGDRTCAVMLSGDVMCWGAGLSHTPQTKTGLTGAKAVMVGLNHTCALLAGGDVKCWGTNTYGQLGNGSTVSSTPPVSVTGLSSGVVAIGGSVDHTCAIKENREVWCWGRNNYSQAGNGKIASVQATPVFALTLPGEPIGIVGGELHTCALSTAAIRCWGLGSQGQLGDGMQNSRILPQKVAGLSDDNVAMSVGGHFGCALSVAGGVKCWGLNDHGRLGDGSLTSRYYADDVAGLQSGVTKIVLGGAHGCALLGTGALRCWGLGVDGQLGNNATDNQPTPVEVFASGIADVSAGNKHTCVLTTAGGVKCFGDNFAGYLGDGTTEQRLSPVDVVGLASGVEAIYAGKLNCARMSTGAHRCWGHGSLFPTTQENRLVPEEMPALGSDITGIASGLSACARTTSGKLFCWGHSDIIDFAMGGRYYSPTYVRKIGDEVSSFSVGEYSVCAILAGNRVKCWGRADYGQIGDGIAYETTSYQPVPKDVLGLSAKVAAIESGNNASCALMDSGEIRCWGDQRYGMSTLRQPLGLGCPSVWAGPMPLDATCSASGSLTASLVDLETGEHAVHYLWNDTPSNALTIEVQAAP